MPFNSNNDDTAKLAEEMTNAVLDDPASDTSEKCDEHFDNDFRESSTDNTNLKSYMQQLIQEKKQRSHIDTSTQPGREALQLSLTCSLSLLNAILQHEPAFTDLTPNRYADLLDIHNKLLAEISQCEQAIKDVQTPAAGELSPFFTDRHAEQFPTPSEAAGKGPKHSRKK